MSLNQPGTAGTEMIVILISVMNKKNFCVSKLAGHTGHRNDCSTYISKERRKVSVSLNRPGTTGTKMIVVLISVKSGEKFVCL